jgi:hypothetical protein
MEAGRGFGVDDDGSILADGVTWESASSTPLAGDWARMSFIGTSASSRLDGCTIRHGGSEGEAVHIGYAMVVIEGTTFEDNEGNVDIATYDGALCARYGAATMNRYQHTPCAED